MDRSVKPEHQHHSSVRAVGIIPLEFVLRAYRGKSGESAADAIDRRAIYTTTVFRFAEDDRLAPQSGTSCESQAGRTANASNGTPGNLPEAPAFSARNGSSNLSLPASGGKSGAAQPSLEHRHHLYPFGARIRLFGCGYRLVQPLRVVLGTINHTGHRLLHFGFGMGIGKQCQARDLQYRPGRSVHQHRVHPTPRQSFHSDQHGWERSRFGQCLCRTTLAHCQVRGGISERLPEHRNGIAPTQGIFRVLQPRAVASVARVFDPRSHISTVRQTESRALVAQQCRSSESMSFLRHREPHQPNAYLSERARLVAAPSLIVLMSLRLVIPGGLLSSIARFRFANRKKSAKRGAYIQVIPSEATRNNGRGLFAVPNYQARFTTLRRSVFCTKDGGKLRHSLFHTNL